TGRRWRSRSRSPRSRSLYSYFGMSWTGGQALPVQLIFRSGALEDAELLKRGHSIIEADLLCDSAVFDTEHGRPGESHLPTGSRRKGADEEVAEGGAGVRPAAFPAADHVVALGDQVCGAREVEVRERLAEPGHELLYIVAAAARRMQ